MKLKINILNLNKKYNFFKLKNKNYNFFIGPWCKKKINFFNEKKVDYLNEYNDLNKKKYRFDTKYLTKIYKYLLKELTDSLNKVHETRFDQKSWEIILGRWLMTWINQIYFRWIYLEKITKKYKINFIYNQKYNKSKFIPKDTMESHIFCRQKNEWTEYIFQEILLFKHRDKINLKFIKNNSIKKIKKEKDFCEIPNAFFYKKNERFLIYKLYCNIFTKIKLKINFLNFGFFFLKKKFLTLKELIEQN